MSQTIPDARKPVGCFQWRWFDEEQCIHHQRMLRTYLLSARRHTNAHVRQILTDLRPKQIILSPRGRTFILS